MTPSTLAVFPNTLHATLIGTSSTWGAAGPICTVSFVHFVSLVVRSQLSRTSAHAAVTTEDPDGRPAGQRTVFWTPQETWAC